MDGSPGVEGKGRLMRPSCENQKGRIKHSSGSWGRVRGIRNLPIRPVFFLWGGREYPPVVCFPLLAKQYCPTGVHRNMCSQSAFFQPVPSAVVKHDSLRNLAEKYHAEQALFYFNFSFRRAEARTRRTRSTNDARRERPSRRA